LNFTDSLSTSVDHHQQRTVFRLLGIPQSANDA
jgi:hypothetical protein